MTEIVLGTANLFGATDATTSWAVLHTAAGLGFRRFDTAPSYGYGDSEAAVGELARTLGADAVLTTKVGLDAGVAPGRSTRIAKAAARRLPGAVQNRLRGGPPGEVRGRFPIEDVRRSIDRSLRRLPRVDRLLLHEPRPEDLTADLVECLQGYRDRGDVGAVGIAGPNRVAAESVARAPELFDVVHLSVALGATLPDLPAGVRRVGHGALGAGGADLLAVRSRLRDDPDWRRRWQAAGERAGFGANVDPVDVLVARAAGFGLDGVVVATSRPERLERLHRAVVSPVPVTPDLLTLLDEARP